MATKGIDLFCERPGTANVIRCRVCGQICTVTRDCFGPTNVWMSMGGAGVLHDRFECPDVEAPAHVRAARLLREAEGTASERLRGMLLEEMEEVLAGVRAR
jgi:hypothetical protein